MTAFRALSLLLLFISFAIHTAAQDDDTIRVSSSIVRLNVGVADKAGRPVLDLGPESFEVFEDGVKQQIVRFEPVTTPFSVVLMLDMSGSTLGFRQVIRQSAIRFVDALSPQDRVAVIEFYDKVEVRNDFTTDRRTIVNSIEVANGRGKTHFYKALNVAIDKLSRENTRRKAVIVLTDGVDSQLKERDRERLERLRDDQISGSLAPENGDVLGNVLNRADAQGITIYPLVLPTGDPARLADPTPRQVEMFRVASERLGMLARRSGGTLNAINRLEDMGRLYAVVAADLRTLYTVEYQPANEKRDGRWRSVRINVKAADLISRTRQGYFAR